MRARTFTLHQTLVAIGMIALGHGCNLFNGLDRVRFVACGDGLINGGEGCDDGNDHPGDGCSEVCAVEKGYGCKSEPSLCADIDECAAGSDDCHERATCTNTAGSFSCACERGYSGDGVVCEPIVVRQAVAGQGHSCALLSTGSVKCWGLNDHGQLGLGDAASRGGEPGQMGNRLPAVELGAGKTAAQLAAGSNHTCAVLNDGTVKCWGMNHLGQLGLGGRDDRGARAGEMGDDLPAVDLGAGRIAVQLAAGHEHTCALLDGGGVKCWGGNGHGQLGLGHLRGRGDGRNEMGDQLAAIDLGAGKIAVQVVAGDNHTCALLHDGTVKCWGENVFGQLGRGDTADRGDEPDEMGDHLAAVELAAGNAATRLAAGAMHTCALVVDGSVQCWGGNLFGQLGQGNKDDRGDDPDEMGDHLTAAPLGSGKAAAQIAAGGTHSCGLLNDGAVKCWGAADRGQLGLGDAENDRGDSAGEMGDALSPVDLGSGKSATRLTAGGLHTCAVLKDGSLKCWGDNEHGQLGLGDTEPRGGRPGDMGDSLPPVSLF